MLTSLSNNTTIEDNGYVCAFIYYIRVKRNIYLKIFKKRSDNVLEDSSLPTLPQPPIVGPSNLRQHLRSVWRLQQSPQIQKKRTYKPVGPFSDYRLNSNLHRTSEFDVICCNIVPSDGVSLMLAGSEYQSLGKAIVKEDEYEEMSASIRGESGSIGHRVISDMQTLVTPHFDYCDVLLSDLSSELSVKLQRAQNMCVRYVCNIRRQLFNDAVSTTRLFRVDGIGDSKTKNTQKFWGEGLTIECCVLIGYTDYDVWTDYEIVMQGTIPSRTTIVRHMKESYVSFSITGNNMRWLFNDAVSTTRLVSVDRIGDSEMVFGEMMPMIRHSLPDIRLTVGENLGKIQPVSKVENTALAQFNTMKAASSDNVDGLCCARSLEQQLRAERQSNVSRRVTTFCRVADVLLRIQYVLEDEERLNIGTMYFCLTFHKYSCGNGVDNDGDYDDDDDYEDEENYYRSLPSKETLRGHSDSSFRGEGYIQCCVGIRLCDMYSNEELAEIHFMYGKAHGNDALARRLYQERYPQRQCPDRKTFVRLHYRLCEYGKFNSHGLGRGRPRSTTPEVQEEILEAVNMTPSISTRRVALQVNVPHTTVWRLLKEYQFFNPHLVNRISIIVYNEIHFKKRQEFYLQILRDLVFVVIGCVRQHSTTQIKCSVSMLTVQVNVNKYFTFLPLQVLPYVSHKSRLCGSVGRALAFDDEDPSSNLDDRGIEHGAGSVRAEQWTRTVSSR
ncbi:hypothetical protein ANN_23282 [Periplaneta americana]|uniref:DUF4817 domain-containing protein n=1 Tax=Periplaneta americana TaxID=6978 RepID=A0ABQ8SKN9_PERAM|nr:hypothetical protein ANN_23282 [Periplaneta americana]